MTKKRPQPTNWYMCLRYDSDFAISTRFIDVGEATGAAHIWFRAIVGY